MLTLLHYLPHFLFAALTLLALGAMFSDDDARKHSRVERPRRHYAWNDQRADRD
jgi:hypothetical protein